MRTKSPRYDTQPGAGGPNRARTDDLLNAIEALFQLSYGPVLPIVVLVALLPRAARSGGCWRERGERTAAVLAACSTWPYAASSRAKSCRNSSAWESVMATVHCWQTWPTQTHGRRSVGRAHPVAVRWQQGVEGLPTVGSTSIGRMVQSAGWTSCLKEKRAQQRSGQTAQRRSRPMRRKAACSRACTRRYSSTGERRRRAI